MTKHQETLKLSNKALSTTIGIVVTASLVVGSIITGTLLARRYQREDIISFQEAIDIACAIPEIEIFIEENDIDSISAVLNDTIWIVEFYASGFNYSEDYYYWLNYAYVEINGLTEEVIFFEVFDPQEPNYTEEQILEIATNIPEISTWLSSIEEFQSEACEIICLGEDNQPFSFR